MRGMTTITSAVAALALVAAPLAAQAGRGQGPAMGRGMMEGGPEAMARNPATVVLEHRDALALTADQVATAERLEARIEEENGPRWAQLEEAFGDADPAEMSLEDRQAMRARMQELAPVREAIRETNRTVMTELHEMLTAEQETELRSIMRRSRRADGPGARGVRGARPGDRMVGAAWRSGFRAGMARGCQGSRAHRGARPTAPGGPGR